ncbi:MAG: hypothetical protein GY953_18155 [bacterium]|nr:hypothetical protein [bacterium]
MTLDSETTQGVRFTIGRMSFGRRVELTRRIRELGRTIDFLEAGEDVQEKIEATLLANEVEQAYLEWGLKEIAGLQIDGAEATPELLVASGPEELCREIAAAIKVECRLGEDERKN